MEPIGGEGETQLLSLEFRGRAREYFRIWVVNLCLTLLTFGIFSAWAKVRKKRYFYSHTVLDGTPLQYLGQPVPILKGRLIAALMFSVYYAASHFFTGLMPYVLASGVVLAPWVIVRSAAFNARYSAWRNMTFGFKGKYMDALKAIYFLSLVPAVVVASIFLEWNKVLAISVAVFGLIFPWWIRRLKNFIVANTSFGGKFGSFSARGGQFFGIYFKGGLVAGGLVLIVGILIDVIGYSIMQMTWYVKWLSALPIYVAYVSGYAYVKARTGNLVWNSTRLGPLRFDSTLRARDMMGLYITNALAIIFSIGLLTPWAVMRTLRYRAENMKVILEGRLAEFQGAPDTATVKAAGAEVGEFFEVDLSL
jgi:uncharacterized membrane protein YjgN (DUF898 family)